MAGKVDVKFTCQSGFPSPTSITSRGARRDRDQPNLPLCVPVVEFTKAGSNPSPAGVKRNGKGPPFSTGEGVGAQVTRGNEVVNSLGLASNSFPPEANTHIGLSASPSAVGTLDFFLPAGAVRGRVRR